jgi:hypothetical protein
MSGRGGGGLSSRMSPRVFVRLMLFFNSARVRSAPVIRPVIFPISRTFSCHALVISF